MIGNSVSTGTVTGCAIATPLIHSPLISETDTLVPHTSDTVGGDCLNQSQSHQTNGSCQGDETIHDHPTETYNKSSGFLRRDLDYKKSNSLNAKHVERVPHVLCVD
eukprot:Selendium_serpulae@DN10838_c0_g1_i1.p1